MDLTVEGQILEQYEYPGNAAYSSVRAVLGDDAYRVIQKNGAGQKLTSADRALIHSLSQKQLADRTDQLVGAVWNRTVDPTRLDATFPTFGAAASRIIASGRQASANLSANYYKAEMAAHGSHALAVTGDPANRAQMLASLHATGPARVKAAMEKGLSLEDANAAGLRGVKRSARRQVQDGGREFLNKAIRKDHRLRGARYSRGKTTCSFCRMLIGRGPVYNPELKFKSHDGCDCGTRIVWADDPDAWSDEAKRYRDLWDKYHDFHKFDAANRILTGKTKYSHLLGREESSALRAQFERLYGGKSPWQSAVDDARKLLPDDEMGRRTLGMNKIDRTADDVLRARLDEESLKCAGMDYKSFMAKYEKAMKQHDDMDALYEWLWKSENMQTGRTWNWDRVPDDIREKLKALGLARKSPKTCRQAIRDMVIGRDGIQLSNMRNTFARLEATKDAFWKYLSADDFVGWADDIDDFGRLGKRTQAQLDALLKAGKELDDELRRRVEKRMESMMMGRDAWNEYNATLAEMMALRKKDPFNALIDVKARRLRELAPYADMWKGTQIEVWSDEARKLLAEVRGVGGGARPVYNGTKEMKSVMETAHKFYPDDWNNAAAAKYPEWKLGKARRGYNDRTEMKLVLSEDLESMTASHGTMSHTAVHELGHTMEHAVPGLNNMEWAYHYQRSNKVPLANGAQRLANPIDIYGDRKEWAIPDGWTTNYTGKTYHYAGKRGGLAPRAKFYENPAAAESYELFTTGVESLFEGSPYFGSFGTDRRLGSVWEVNEDAEMRQFILGCLGVL